LRLSVTGVSWDWFQAREIEETAAMPAAVSETIRWVGRRPPRLLPHRNNDAVLSYLLLTYQIENEMIGVCYRAKVFRGECDIIPKTLGTSEHPIGRRLDCRVDAPYQ
jgi:hypothetical protein